MKQRGRGLGGSHCLRLPLVRNQRAPFFSVPGRRDFFPAGPRELPPCRPVSARTPKGEIIMLYWALVFLVVGLIAGILGFTGIAGASIAIAKILFFVFIVIFLALLIGGLTIA